jgi:4-hydroxybenzoate polyprenyltransferase
MSNGQHFIKESDPSAASPDKLEENPTRLFGGFASVFVNLCISLRPYQWTKNGLVFGGLIFSRSLSNPIALLMSTAGFVIFCAASSGVYLLNDLQDFQQDRVHPIKRHRPVAAGLLSRKVACWGMILLIALSVTSGLLLRRSFGAVVIAYIAVNIAYSLGLKRAVVLDVMIVASGFVLRAVGGAFVVGVKPSEWLMLCTLMLALLMSFGKRRHELTSLEGDAHNHRLSLEGYSLQSLDLMMASSAAAAVVTYALYTMAEETVERFGSRALVLTTPIAFYGIFRYLYLVHKRSEGGDPTRLLLSDGPTLLAALLWIIAVCLIIYGHVNL